MLHYFLASITAVHIWLTHKKDIAKDGFVSKLRSGLDNSQLATKLHTALLGQIAQGLWSFFSDGAYYVYSQVTDIITVHQVFDSRQLRYAFLLLAIFLLPTVAMLAPVAVVSVRICQKHTLTGSCSRVGRVSACLLGLLLSPFLLLGLEIAIVFHGVGIPLPAWFDALDVDMHTFYHLQSFAESFLNALPQSVLQSKLYLVGNDPNGVYVYIDTTLFLYSVIGSLLSVLKSVIVFRLERGIFRERHMCDVLHYVVPFLFVERSTRRFLSQQGQFSLQLPLVSMLKQVVQIVALVYSAAD